jgi:hypothetical protein
MKLEKIKTITIIVLILILWFKGCNNSENPSVNTKDVFKTDTIIIHKKIKSEIVRLKGKDIIVYKNNEINKELALSNYNLQIAYQNAKDSIEKENLYKTSIELKSFEQPFENDNFKANVSGIVQGEIKNLQLEYELKKIPLEKTKLRMFLGSGISLKAIDFNIGFQNAKGNILEIGYDTEKNIRVGYKQTIFSIKKP